MSVKEDLEDGEIAEDIRNADSDSRFDNKFNETYLSIDSSINKSNDFYSRQTKVNQISPIFQSMFAKSPTSDPLFGSIDTDLRLKDNQINDFNDCDLRFIQTNQSIRHSLLNNNNNNYSYIPQNPRKPILLNPTNDSLNQSSIRRQLNDSTNSSKLFQNNLNNNNLYFFGSQESHPISSSYQMCDKQIEIRPQLRPNKALLPTPIMPFSESNQSLLQQIDPSIRSRFERAPNLHINPKSLNANQFMPHLKTNYSAFLSPPLVLYQNVPQMQTQTAINSSNPTSTQRNSTEFVNSTSINFFDKTSIDANNSTIVLGSDEIEEVQMIDDCGNNGSQSPYDPEQEVIYIPPLSPPVISIKSINENNLINNSKDFKLKDENSIISQSRSQLKSNEIPFISENRNKSFNFGSNLVQRSRNTRSGSEERKERLKRLLESNSIDSIDSKVSPKICSKGHQKKSKSRVDESVTPKKTKKSSNNSRSPVRKGSHKVSVHRESCKRAKNSRRNFKRIRKRKVLTQNSNQMRDFRPKSRNEIQDASYEDLLEEYKRIQNQLKDLEKEEEKNEIITIYESDKEGEVIEENDVIVENNQINEDSKEDQMFSLDDDELELRRLALESKKVKVQTTPDIDIESSDEELDENVLRQQLLQSLLRAKSNNDSPNITETINDNEIQSKSMEQNENQSEIEPVIENQTEKEIIMNEENESNSKKDQITVVSVPKPKLIINFGDDSSDDEQEIQKTSRKVVTATSESNSSSVPVGLESFLRQARMRTEPKLSPVNVISPQKKKATAVVGKLSITQQMEYKKLKAEIARREKYQVSDTLLKQNEVKWKSAKANLQEKISKVNALKTKVALKRNALRKAQQHARKMQEAFIAATRVVSANAAEFHSINEELKNSENAVTVETNNVNQFEKQCIRIGLKLRGNSYKLPIAAILKRSDSISISPNKKFTKSETIQLSKQKIADEKKRLQELERLYSKRLQDLKNSSLLRSSSPKLIAPKSPQIVEISDSNIDKTLTISKIQDSQKVLQNIVKEFQKSPQNHSLISLKCFLELMFFDQNIKPLESNLSVPKVDFKISLSVESDYCNDSYDSVLSHLQSYRFVENQPKDISSNHWTNNLNPLESICRYDLLGTCNDEKCLWQHINQCLLDSSNKLVDLLLYDPKLAGLTSEIPDRFDIDSLHKIRQKLLQFAQKMIDSKPQISIETHSRQIANQIRERSNESVACLLRRRIPKLFGSSKIEVPFDDLLYKFSIKDKSLVLNESKISQLRLSVDPDIYFKNRFYAPEGVPISAELETTLASDPNNIQLWIKLAYYHITKCSDNSFADSIDRALNVLSRALEHNRTDPELFEHYLFIYSNRVIRTGEDSKLNLINICRKVVKHCPHYRVWKCFLTLCTSFEDKKSVSTELLNNLIKNIVINDNLETRSHQILEVLLYKIHLNLELNNYNLSVLELNRALNKSLTHSSSETQTQNTDHISDELTNSDRVFGWLCYLHLLIYHKLPAHCFLLYKQEFPQIIDKSPFVFDWSLLIDIINIEEIKNCLNTALKLCSTNQNDFNDCLVLYINLAELNLYDTNETNSNVYEDMLQMTQNDAFLWTSIVEHRFKSQSNHLNLINVLKESPFYMKDEIKLYLSVATHYYEMNDLINARNELLKIAAIYYSSQISHSVLKLAFEAILFEDEENNHNFELINARKSKGSRSAILWLSYILLLNIDSDSERQIDSAFQSALALCSIDKTSSVDLQLLWWNYLKFLMKNIRNQNEFLDTLELVRHCCLTISDDIFQLQIVRFLCQFLSNSHKLNALMEFAKLIPHNIYITMNAISFALLINKKDMCWLLINSIIFDKKIRLKYLDFWKIAIALAIERSDHLSVHKFFQMAISLLPYNAVLWETFKTYETSIKHTEHLKQAKDLCLNQLKTCEDIFLL